jgi:Flp pilus assembly protein TadD
VANALAKVGRHQEILPYLQEAQRRRPDLPTIYAALGQTLMLLHRFDEAATEIKKAIQLDPGNAEYRGLLARAQAAGRN